MVKKYKLKSIKNILFSINSKKIQTKKYKKIVSGKHKKSSL